MKTLKDLSQKINYYAATNVDMQGAIDSQGIYKGTLEAGSTDELYEFLRLIAETRGEAFDRVQIRHGTITPPTFTCYIEFDTTALAKTIAYIMSSCPTCGQRVQAPPSRAGTCAACPGCGREIVIGNATRKTKSHPIPNHTEPAAEQKKSVVTILSSVYFKSSNHNRYNEDVRTEGDNRGCMRAIEVKADPENDNSYIVTLYNLSEVHPQWGDNIQVAPKRMRVVASSAEEITLRGYGQDPMLTGRPPQIQENYGIKLHMKRGSIDHVSYYLYDRNVRIDFLQ